MENNTFSNVNALVWLRPKRASTELLMNVGNWHSTREAFEWHEAKSSASLAYRLFSKFPRQVHP